jgi:hypothetical protein
MGVTHSTVVVVADDGTSPVGTDEWNAAHSIDTITMVQDAQTPLTVTRFFVNAVASYNGFVQVQLQNHSNGASASSDVVCTTDTGTDTAEYIDMGINSSGFTGAWGGPKDGYLYVDGGAAAVGDLVLGTAQTGTHIYFDVAGGTAANRKMEIAEESITVNVPIIGSTGTSLMMHAGMFMQ